MLKVSEWMPSLSIYAAELRTEFNSNNINLTHSYIFTFIRIIIYILHALYFMLAIFGIGSSVVYHSFILFDFLHSPQPSLWTLDVYARSILQRLLWYEHTQKSRLSHAANVKISPIYWH